MTTIQTTNERCATDGSLVERRDTAIARPEARRLIDGGKKQPFGDKQNVMDPRKTVVEAAKPAATTAAGRRNLITPLVSEEPSISGSESISSLMGAGTEVDSRASPTSVVVDNLNDHNNLQSANDQIRQLIEEKQRLQEALDAAQAQRSKMIANIKKKKAFLETAQADNKTLRDQLKERDTQLETAHSQNLNLRSGLEKVSSARNELRDKLRVNRELLTCTRQEKDDVQSRLRRCQAARVTEQKLLAEYRKLSQHTGFYRWGKQIRILENELSIQAEQEQQD